jgi:phospholipase C
VRPEHTARLAASCLAAAAVVAAGCGGGGLAAPGGAPQAPAPRPTATPTPVATPTPSPTPLAKISHVVIVIQENRSFDNLFQGYPGADTVSSGLDSTGQTVPLAPVGFGIPWDVKHGVEDFLPAFDNGKMDGFDRERINGIPGIKHPQYAYVPQSQTQLYFQIASRYVLADRMFASHLDASFAAHQYLIAAQAGHSVDLPFGVWGCGSVVDTLKPDRSIGPQEPACFDYPTLADEAAAAGRSWRFYVPPPTDTSWLYNGFAAISHIRYGPGWANVVSPETTILGDVASGKLPNVSWVIPAFANSDHASGGGSGQQWVSTVINAIGNSPFWNSTAIFVVWDEWGGWYDHVPPPQLDFDGLGFRVPMIVVSAYAKSGYVSHVQYEFGSILRYAEDRFGLARMAASDARATSPELDCFNVSPSATPRPFVPFATMRRPIDFLREAPSRRPPDEE